MVLWRRAKLLKGGSCESREVGGGKDRKPENEGASARKYFRDTLHHNKGPVSK